MNDGLRILIERMQKCPEDFATTKRAISSSYDSRWSRMLDKASSMAGADIFSEEEARALHAARLELEKFLFTADVLAALAADGQEQKVEAESQYVYANNGTATLTASSAIMPARILQVGSAGLTEDDIHAIKKQLGR